MNKYSLRDIAIGTVILLAVIAILYVAVQAMGVPIPPWVIHVLWVVLIACVCILAIKFLTSGSNGSP